MTEGQTVRMNGLWTKQIKIRFACLWNKSDGHKDPKFENDNDVDDGWLPLSFKYDDSNRRIVFVDGRSTGILP